MNPDVIARFDTIELEQEAPDRVLVQGIKGEPAPDTTKVCINYLGGFRNSMSFVLTGLDIEEKARLAEETLLAKIGGRESFDEVTVQLVRSDQEDPETNELAGAVLRVTVKDRDERKVGRAFSGAATEMALASYPGFYGAGRPGEGESFGVYWPALVKASEIDQAVVGPDGAVHHIPAVPATAGAPVIEARHAAGVPVPAGPTVRAPLGRVAGARSGDKGGNANVGLWTRSDEAFAWLAGYLTVERFKELVGEARDLEVRRYELPNLRALNFVVVGLLGEGVASSTRQDAQAKSFGEYVRAKVVDLPASLLGDA